MRIVVLTELHLYLKMLLLPPLLAGNLRIDDFYHRPDTEVVNPRWNGATRWDSHTAGTEVTPLGDTVGVVAGDVVVDGHSGVEFVVDDRQPSPYLP